MAQDLLDTRIFAKAAIVKAMAFNLDSYKSYAASRWPGQEGQITRAAVGDIGSADFNAPSFGADVLKHVVKQSVLGPMLRNMWKVEFQQPFNAAATGLGANWVSEMNPAPISRTSLDKDSLERLKVQGLCVFSDDALKYPNGEDAVERSLIQVSRDLLDDSFLFGPGFSGEVPRAIPQTAGVVSIASTSDPAASFRALIKNFGGQLTTTYFITDPETAGQLALYPNTPFPDAGITGGTIAGVPLIVSENSPRDSSGGQIVMLDASRVAIALGAVEVSRSKEASIMMVDDMDSNGTGQFVSLFQCDAQALKVTINANWKLLDASGCRLLTGCDW